MPSKEKLNNHSHLLELFEQFLKQSKSVEGRALATINNYQDNFNLLKIYKENVALSDLKPEFIIEFFAFLNGRERKVGKKLNVVRTLKNSSTETTRAKLNTFFKWLEANKHIKKNPFKGMKHAEVNYLDGKAFTKDELDRIFLAVSRDIQWETKLAKTRNLAMLMTLVLTGIRKGEFLGLNLSDLDFAKKQMTIRGETSKSKRTYITSINSELEPFLEDYLEQRAEYITPFLWVSSKKDNHFTQHGLKHLVEKLKDASGVHIHVHRFRHTFAVNLYLQTHDLLVVNKALNHKSLKQTISYLRSISNDEYIKQIDKLTVAEFV